MGGCFSVSLPCDQAVNQASSYLCAKAAYVHNLEENLDDLTTAVQTLGAKRDDLRTRVRTEENRGLQCLDTIKDWLSRVEATENKVGELLNLRIDEIQKKLCLCGYASKNCISTYQYGKKVIKQRKYVELLESELRTFEAVAQEVPAPMVDSRPIEPPVGMETIVEEAWKCLMDDEVGILGLYGMGGVGKTTLLTQINNKFSDSMNEFDVVIWVVVSQDLRPERIQEEIGKKLAIYNERWRQKRQEEKASDISNVLRRKNFVLLLDDIWKKVNLTEIGIPFPDRRNGCKVAFTTRSREVCGRMGVKAEIEVRCLAPDVAWELFRNKVGENTLNSHPDILELAEIVAEKCRGLPLALNIIGETMASKKTLEEWRGAIDVLTSSAVDFPGMEDEILPVLKFSYDNLKGEKVKSGFVYCALFPEDFSIDVRGLLDYWVGEGIIDKNKERDEVENEGYEIIGTLVRACLLEGGKNEETVKMHDVVREMALWIASGLGKQKENLVVQTGVGLKHIPKVKDWENVSRMSVMQNEIENISSSPNCPKLLTLFLNANRLVNISSEFFRLMPLLGVLDLSNNKDLEELPEEVSMLVSLQYLNLSHTRLRQLPIGLKELRKLIYLDLEYTTTLRDASVSSLSNLQVLRLLGSHGFLGCNLGEELQHLDHLTYFTMPRVIESCLQEFMNNDKLRCWLDTLIFTHSDISKMEMGWKNSLSNSCFRMLHHVRIEYCTQLKELTWLIFAPNIGVLILEGLLELEEIINKKKVVGVTNEQPFGKLGSLEIYNVRKLEYIHWEPLPFPYLKNVCIADCPKLRKLAFDSKSAEGRHVVLKIREEQMEQLEWEDEDTRQRFFPKDSPRTSSASVPPFSSKWSREWKRLTAAVGGRPPNPTAAIVLRKPDGSLRHRSWIVTGGDLPL